MRKTILALLLFCSVAVQAQFLPQYVRNSLDTNDNVVAMGVVSNAVGGILQRGSNVIAGTLQANGQADLNAGAVVGGAFTLTDIGSGVLVNNGGTVGPATIGSGLSLVGVTLSADAGGVASLMTKTNFVLNQLYTNTSPTLVRASVFLVQVATPGQSSLDLMQSTAGGAFSMISRVASSTASVIASTTNDITAVLTNLGTYYFTNTSAGAGNVAGLVDGSGQIATFGGGTMGATLSPGTGITITADADTNTIAVNISGIENGATGATNIAAKTFTSAANHITFVPTRNADGTTNVDMTVIGGAAASAQPPSPALTNIADLPYPAPESSTLRWRFGVPTWHEEAAGYYVNDNFVAQASIFGGASSAAGGATAGFTSFPATTRQARNGFFLMRVWGTNGIGVTHYARLIYQSFAQHNLFTNAFGFESDVLFESGTTNILLQLGLLNAITSSNQTAGVFWEHSPAKSTNFIARCVGSSSISQTCSIGGDINTWVKLGIRIAAGTNGPTVFYTNNVAFWTNTVADNMPTVGMHLAAITVNSSTNASGGGALGNSVYLDHVKAY